MVKKIMVGLLVAMVGVCFAAEFNRSDAWKFVKDKNYTGLQTYLKTNNECKTEESKFSYGYLMLMVRAEVVKDLNATNLLTVVKEEVKNKKIDDKEAVGFLYRSRLHIPEMNKNQLFAKYVKTYFEQTPNMKPTESVIFAYCHLKDYDNVIKFLPDVMNSLYENAYGEWIKGYIINVLKNSSVQQKVAYFNVIKDNPVKYISTAKNLNDIVTIAATITETKYDTSMKELYVRLNRTFYSKMLVSEEWKQALVKLNLQMKAYGL